MTRRSVTKAAMLVRAIISALVVASGAASAQQPIKATAPPCSGPDYRALDFWTGDWKAYDPASGKEIGTNLITRDEYGACVITEHFALHNGTLKGHSVSTYRPGLKQWRQTWVDDQGGYFDLVGGPVANADHIFVFETKRVSARQPHQRMIWQDVKPDRFTWRWQQRAKDGEPWTDSWVIDYRRK